MFCDSLGASITTLSCSNNTNIFKIIYNSCFISARVPGCGDPGTPVNGRRIGNIFSVGAMVFFRCFDDFDLIGSKFRKCQPSGLWSGVQPVCNPFNGKNYCYIITRGGLTTSRLNLK